MAFPEGRQVSASATETPMRKRVDMGRDPAAAIPHLRGRRWRAPSYVLAASLGMDDLGPSSTQGAQEEFRPARQIHREPERNRYFMDRSSDGSAARTCS